jgi:phosphohistidine phosphatase
MPERTLILLRHAKSDWSGSEADMDRPLNDRGVRQAPKAGRWLAENVKGIDLAVVSPAKRAVSTWHLASAELDHEPPVRMDDRLYAASVEELLEVVRTLPDDVHAAAVVGHNPGIESLASLLAEESVLMPTSALAVIGWDGPWSDAGESRAIMLASGRPPVENSVG